MSMPRSHALLSDSAFGVRGRHLSKLVRFERRCNCSKLFRREVFPSIEAVSCAPRAAERHPGADPDSLAMPAYSGPGMVS
jgi:hypothetical protein